MGWIKTIERRSKRRLMGLLGLFLRARPITVDDFRRMHFDRILVSRQHNQMGDMMLAIPALRAIKEAYPRSNVGVVTSALNRDVLDNNPFVDEVFTYNKRSLMSMVRLLRRIRRGNYDLAIALHTVSFSFTTLMLVVLSRARVRIGSTSHAAGESFTGSYLNITLPLPTPAELAGLNEAEHNLYPLRAVGIDTSDLAPVIVPGAESETWARSFAEAAWQGERLRLAVHPGAGKTENIWPPERFAAVVNSLARVGEVALVALEGPRDAGAVDRFVVSCDSRAVRARGRSIGDIAALMRMADLVICNDTGVMHVAAAVGATTLAVFGSTDPLRWAPRCNNLHIVRSDDGALASVTVDMVSEKAAAIMGLILPAERYLER